MLGTGWMNAWLQRSRFELLFRTTKVATSHSLWSNGYSSTSSVATSFETDPSVRSGHNIPAPVRPGPWKRSTSQWKHLGRVYGDAYEAAKSLNIRIVDNATEALECLKSSRTKSDSKHIASIFLYHLAREIDKLGSSITFVNVSTAIHRVGLVVGTSGAGDGILNAHSKFLGRLGTLIHQHEAEFGPRQLANIFWGLGKCGEGIRQIEVDLPIKLPYPPTMDDVIRMLLKKVKGKRQHLRSVNFSNVFLGLAYLNYRKCKRFKIACAPYVKSELHNFTPQQLSNFTWALSKLTFVDEPGLLPAIAKTSIKMITKFSPRELCGLMQGMSALRYDGCQELFDDCMSVLRGQLSLLSAREVYTLIMVWSDSMYHPGETTLQAAAKHLSAQLLNGQHGLLASALMSLAHLGHDSPPLVLAATHFLKSNVPSTDFQARDVCNMLWALAMLNSLQKEHLICARKKLGKLVSGAVQDVEMNQLHQAQVHAKIFIKGVPEGSESALLWNDLAHQCRRKWIECQEHHPIPPGLNDVEYVLEGMGYVTREKWIQNVALKVRVASRPEEKKGFIVEVISGSRCFVNDRNKLSGPYLWRERVLTALGETVVRVDATTFKNSKLKVDKEKYLGSLLVGKG
ncbi:hypothetical protein BSKO_14045 [Bryopsis sp. KO-2023]|nr:hypothetical protein BSKO_14045 [Bryopsis sp. KO-2023]